VQLCHGAPGFVTSLLAIRQHFAPALQAKMDTAVAKARACIWKEGMLRKEPCLCHGIFGNALTLPQGPQRDHFLGVAKPTTFSQMKKADETGTLFERADYGRPYSTLTSYGPSAAWAWLVCRQQNPGIIAYNDSVPGSPDAPAVDGSATEPGQPEIQGAAETASSS